MGNKQTKVQLEKLLHVVVHVLVASLPTQLAPSVLLLQSLLVLDGVDHYASLLPFAATPDGVSIQRRNARLVHLILQFPHHLDAIRHNGAVER